MASLKNSISQRQLRAQAPWKAFGNFSTGLFFASGKVSGLSATGLEMSTLQHHQREKREWLLSQIVGMDAYSSCVETWTIIASTFRLHDGAPTTSVALSAVRRTMGPCLGWTTDQTAAGRALSCRLPIGGVTSNQIARSSTCLVCHLCVLLWIGCTVSFSDGCNISTALSCPSWSIIACQVNHWQTSSRLETLSWLISARTLHATSFDHDWISSPCSKRKLGTQSSKAGLLIFMAWLHHSGISSSSIWMLTRPCNAWARPGNLALQGPNTGRSQRRLPSRSGTSSFSGPRSGTLRRGGSVKTELKKPTCEHSVT